MKKSKLKNATRWKLPLYVLLLLVGISAYGQNTTITGVISSTDDGMPLLGANVLVKGTTIGVVSDFDGNYSIKVPSALLLWYFLILVLKLRKLL